MNDNSKNQDETLAAQLIPEISVAADELSKHANKQLSPEAQHEKEIDLNGLFPDTEANLNELFPDMEVKHLLKNITKNKKDMTAIKERLKNENEAPNEDKSG